VDAPVRKVNEKKGELFLLGARSEKEGEGGDLNRKKNVKDGKGEGKQTSSNFLESREPPPPPQKKTSPGGERRFRMADFLKGS